MIIAKRARVIHAPVEDLYQVQYKTWLLGGWNDDETVKYRKEGERPEQYRPHWTQPEALKRAKDRMETLLARAVVVDEHR